MPGPGSWRGGCSLWWTGLRVGRLHKTGLRSICTCTYRQVSNPTYVTAVGLAGPTRAITSPSDGFWVCVIQFCGSVSLAAAVAVLSLLVRRPLQQDTAYAADLLADGSILCGRPLSAPLLRASRAKGIKRIVRGAGDRVAAEALKASLSVDDRGDLSFLYVDVPLTSPQDMRWAVIEGWRETVVLSKTIC